MASGTVVKRCQVPFVCRMNFKDPIRSAICPCADPENFLRGRRGSRSQARLGPDSDPGKLKGVPDPRFQPPLDPRMISVIINQIK